MVSPKMNRGGREVLVIGGNPDWLIVPQWGRHDLSLVEKQEILLEMATELETLALSGTLTPDSVSKALERRDALLEAACRLEDNQRLS